MFGEYPGNLLRRQKSVESILGGQLRCGPLPRSLHCVCLGRRITAKPWLQWINWKWAELFPALRHDEIRLLSGRTTILTEKIILFRFLFVSLHPQNKKRSGFSAVGSVLRSGRRGRWFESSNPDLFKETGWYAACLFCFLWPSYLFFSLCEEYFHSLWFHGKYPVHRRFCLVRNRKLVLTAWQWYAFVALKCSFGGLRLTLARFS